MLGSATRICTWSGSSCLLIKSKIEDKKISISREMFFGKIQSYAR